MAQQHNVKLICHQGTAGVRWPTPQILSSGRASRKPRCALKAKMHAITHKSAELHLLRLQLTIFTHLESCARRWPASRNRFSKPTVTMIRTL